MKHLWMATALLALGCGTPDAGGDDTAERQDGQDDTFVADGKADSNGVEDRFAVRRVPNQGR